MAINKRFSIPKIWKFIPILFVMFSFTSVLGIWYNLYIIYSFSIKAIAIITCVILYIIVRHFINRAWINAIVLFLILIAGLLFHIVLAFLNSIWLRSSYDFHIEQPLSIQSNKLGDRPEYILGKHIDSIHFEVYNSYQYQLYEYDIWYKPTEKGVLFLKGFNIETNMPLHLKHVLDLSEIRIDSTYDFYQRFSSIEAFTVLEDHEHHSFAVRLEVWFKPDLLSKEPYKVISKNVLVE